MMTRQVAAGDDTATLLSSAVHRSNAWSLDGLSERLFTKVFSGMVYAQIWEDPAVDLEALQLRDDSRIITIASGGCNALSYLTASPAEVVSIDLNAAHVALNRLKAAAVKGLEQPEFQDFIEGHGARSGVLFDDNVAPHLDGLSRQFWTKRDKYGRRRIEAFDSNIFRTGLLGRFIGAAHTLAKLYRVDPKGILKSRTVDEQRAFFDNHLSPLFERRLVKLLLTNPASLFGLGIPPAQYRELRTAGATMSDVVKERLRKLACDFPLSENYFAWQAFNRGYGAQGHSPRPPYLEPSKFATLKANIGRYQVVHGSLTTYLEAAGPSRFDRFVLLDAQDWMSPEELTRLWNAIDRTACTDARVIFRTAGEATILPGRIPSELLSRWRYEEEQSAHLHAKDRSAIYGGFHLYKRNAGA